MVLTISTRLVLRRNLRFLVIPIEFTPELCLHDGGLQYLLHQDMHMIRLSKYQDFKRALAKKRQL